MTENGRCIQVCKTFRPTQGCLAVGPNGKRHEFDSLPELAGFLQHSVTELGLGLCLSVRNEVPADIEWPFRGEVTLMTKLSPEELQRLTEFLRTSPEA